LRVTVGIPGSIVFEMAMRGGPLPSRIEIPKDRDAAVMITCSDEQALEMEVWLRIAARRRRDDGEAKLYLRCAALIAHARGGEGRVAASWFQCCGRLSARSSELPTGGS
jgi:hypothetical protein